MNDSMPSVRIGPISLFALIAVICLATLAVLAVNTSRASDSLAHMQADSVTQQYAAESAAQQFVGLVDASAGFPSAQAVTAIATQVQADNTDVTVTAALENGAVTAQFACPNGRLLDIAVAPEGNGYRIAKWNMTAKVNSAETDTLWSGM